jgi:hypothetical protein
MVAVETRCSEKVRSSVRQNPCQFFNLAGSVEAKFGEKVRNTVGFGSET